jgi:hypothetical protein
MAHKIKITKEQSDLFKHTGNIISSSNGDIYMNIPYWLKETDEEYVYEYLTTEQLPDDIIKQQGYSEEDMREAYKWGRIYDMTSFDEWFEQFKKK